MGALSHVLWDATSHSYGSFVSGSTFWNTNFISLPAYKWNQYGGGIVGLGILGIWYFYCLLENLKTPYVGNFRIGAPVYIISILCMVAAANIIHETTGFSDFVVRTSIGVMTGGIVASIVYAIIVKNRSADSNSIERTS